MKIVKVETKAPALRKLPEGNRWEYAELWSCRIHLKGEGVLAVRIAPGYWTDLASVPKALRGAFDNGSGDYAVLVASQVHDMLYSTHYLSKDFSDELFRLLLRFYKMSALKAWLYYEAVALFGRSAWEASDLDLNADRALCALDWLAK